MWEKLNRNGPAFFFDAARYRAVTAAVLRSTDSSPEAGKSSDEEAGRAIEWLHKAVAAGYADVTRLKQDVDLGVLRDREDFKSIIGGLEPKPEEVLAAAREAVHLKPDDAASHVGLGRALIAQSKLDEAAAAFREAVRLNPDFADAYEGLAGVLRTQRKWDEARALDLHDSTFRFASRTTPSPSVPKTQTPIATAASFSAAPAASARRSPTWTRQSNSILAITRSMTSRRPFTSTSAMPKVTAAFAEKQRSSFRARPCRRWANGSPSVGRASSGPSRMPSSSRPASTAPPAIPSCSASCCR